MRRVWALGLALCLSACASWMPPKEQVRFAHSILTPSTPSDRIGRHDQTQFRLDQEVHLVTIVNWSNALSGAGHRKIKWLWYVADLPRIAVHQEVDLIATPYEIYGSMQASTLGTGPHKVECWVDEEMLDSRTFEVTP